MDAIDEPLFGEFVERSGKRRLGGDFRAPFPAADAPERRIDEKAFPQSRRRGQAEDGLGDEGAGDGAPVVARTPRTAGLGAHVGLEADHIERVDQLFELDRERIDPLQQEWEQVGLDVAPERLHCGDRVLFGHD